MKLGIDTREQRVENSPNTRLLLSPPKMTQFSGERERQPQEIPEDSWEDISDEESRPPFEPPFTVDTPTNSFRSASRSSASRSSARRRKPKATSPRRNAHGDHRLRGPREPTPGPPSHRPADVQGPGLLVALPSPADVLCYISDILGTVFRVLKIPISLVLATIACIYVLSLASGAIRTALAPICSIPIISLACPSLEPIKPKPIPRSVPRRPDFPTLINVGGKSLEALLDEAVEGPGLALEIKKAEMATSDLATLVRVSNLNSREVLADTLGKFVKDARKAGRGLTRFSSRVGGAVDKCVILYPN
jgi:hypothetical protein